MENFEIKTIKTEVEHKMALVRLNEVWGAKPNTKDGDILELILWVIEDFETKHYRMPTLSPIEAIKYKMEENDLSQKDLVKYFGTKSRVSEVLNNKKPLTLKMIKSLYKNLGIPAETLLA
jgi:HTH-type transcriptional regulator/antitoxin HigA